MYIIGLMFHLPVTAVYQPTGTNQQNDECNLIEHLSSEEGRVAQDQVSPYGGRVSQQHSRACGIAVWAYLFCHRHLFIYVRHIDLFPSKTAQENATRPQHTIKPQIPDSLRTRGDLEEADRVGLRHMIGVKGRKKNIIGPTLLFFILGTEARGGKGGGAILLVY